MATNAHTFVIVGGSLGALLLIERARSSSSFAGKANQAAAAELAKLGSVAGIQFSIPANASMVDVHAGMSDALAERDPDDLPLSMPGRVIEFWLDAYRAGAAADPVNYALAASDSLAQSGLGGSFTDVEGVCDNPLFRIKTELGEAVCAMREVPGMGHDPASLRAALDASRRVAEAMDAADYLPAGERRSDRVAPHSILELPGRALRAAGELVGEVLGGAASGFAGEVLFSPIGLVLLAGGGFLAWRALR